MILLRLSPLLLLLSTACSTPPDPAVQVDGPAAPVAEESVKPGVNERFLAQDLEVDQFVDIFEGESREIAVNRDGIVAAIGIEAGMEVADVGSGTGLFLPALDFAVRPGGGVFAVDISPGFVEHLEARITKEGLDRVEVVLCSERSAELPERSVDVVFVCDTYHHFEYPRSTLASLWKALRPGGRLVVVDFNRIPGVSRDWCLEHVRAGKEVFMAEIEAAGFELLREVEVEGLVENYVLVFRRA